MQLRESSSGDRLQEMLGRRFLIERPSIRPIGCQRVIDVNDPHHLRKDGNLVAPESLWIPTSIQALMM